MHTFSRFVRPYQCSCAAFSPVPVGNQIAEYLPIALPLPGAASTHRMFGCAWLSPTPLHKILRVCGQGDCKATSDMCGFWRATSSRPGGSTWRRHSQESRSLPTMRRPVDDAVVARERNRRPVLLDGQLHPGGPASRLRDSEISIAPAADRPEGRGRNPREAIDRSR